MNTPTPRTNEAQRNTPAGYVLATFAEQLESELAAALDTLTLYALDQAEGGIFNNDPRPARKAVETARAAGLGKKQT